MKLRNSTRMSIAFPIPGEKNADGSIKTIDLRGDEARNFSKAELEYRQVKAALGGLLVEETSGEPLEVVPSGKVKA
jgi:hypothetical protein